MYDKLIEYFNNSFNLNVDCFKPMRLGKIGLNQRISFGLSSVISPDVNDADSKIEHTVYLLSSHLRNSMIKIILGDILQNGEKNYLDLTSRLLDTQISSRKIIQEIGRLGSNFVISNSRLSSDFMDSSSFSVDPICLGNKMNNRIYKSGILHNRNKIDLYIDSDMGWNNNYVLLFDDVYVDINNFYYKMDTVLQKFEVGYNLGFEIINPKVLYIFDDEHKDNYSLYKQDCRDIKISKILGE